MLAEVDGRLWGTIRAPVFWIGAAVVSRAQPQNSEIVVWRSLDDQDVGRSEVRTSRAIPKTLNHIVALERP